MTLTLAALALLAASTIPAQSGPNLTLSQYDANLDDGFWPNTPMGNALVTFQGFHQPMYFNLSVNGRWEVRNMPLLSVEGPGAPQAANFSFHLGNQLGQNVTQVQAAWLITPNMQAQPPNQFQQWPVQDLMMDLRNGLQGAGPVRLMGPQAQQNNAPIAEGASKHGFPNQEQERNACTNTAVSNSLLWLKQRHGLTFPDSAVSPGTVGGFLGTDGNGTPVEWTGGKEALCAELVRLYGAENRITTTVFGPQLAGYLMGFVATTDIEVDMLFPAGGGHTAAVVNITRSSDGGYWITIKHDLRQGHPGGTAGTHTFKIDANGIVTVGCDGIPVGTRILKFVREMVSGPKSATKGVMID
ncbi:MAG: hypothetical protein KF884_01370 [Fimbriimonadaceae bacterium]|nr:hypothetical protein [Fimbriimonadaceae bacterium]QYK58745.1 MAG: hypothetical protein KF884_01370 [Fimbriimonadaceae bacterium]